MRPTAQVWSGCSWPDEPTGEERVDFRTDSRGETNPLSNTGVTLARCCTRAPGGTVDR